MKDISVTASYLGLEKEIRNCQNIETYNDCITRHYMENSMQECGCLPLSSIMSDKVKKSKIDI